MVAWFAAKAIRTNAREFMKKMDTKGHNLTVIRFLSFPSPITLLYRPFAISSGRKDLPGLRLCGYYLLHLNTPIFGICNDEL